MRAIITFLIVSVLVTPLAYAAGLTWDSYTDTSADGFIIYSKAQDGDEVWSVKIEGIGSTEFALDPQRYPPGNTYEFWMTAYNELAESENSNTATWTPTAFVPMDNPPDVIITIPGPVGSVQINVGQ